MILLIGDGSISKRYQAILRKFNYPFKIFDNPLNENPEDIGNMTFDRAIICTPTRFHYQYAKLLLDLDKPFLCEKPVSKDINDCDVLLHHENAKNGWVVNNWSLAILRTVYRSKISKISYNYYHTGGDGLVWDVCQLALIAKMQNCILEVSRDTPIFQAKVVWGGGLESVVSLEDIQRSYVDMITNFCDDYRTMNSWLTQGALMTSTCLDILNAMGHAGVNENEGFSFDPGKNSVHALTR